MTIRIDIYYQTTDLNERYSLPDGAFDLARKLSTELARVAGGGSHEDEPIVVREASPTGRPD